MTPHNSPTATLFPYTTLFRSAVNGSDVRVKGPKGTLELRAHPEMLVKVEGAEINVDRPTDQRFHRSLHGLTRTLDRKSTSLNSSHLVISYAVVCLMKTTWVAR